LVQKVIPDFKRRASDVARKVSTTLGSGWAFLAACAVVLVWALIGPALGFSDAWQLVINTGTTIVTFLIHYRAPIVDFCNTP
jgi:low affinity Fe/Cu permease